MGNRRQRRDCCYENCFKGSQHHQQHRQLYVAMYLKQLRVREVQEARLWIKDWHSLSQFPVGRDGDEEGKVE